MAGRHSWLIGGSRLIPDDTATNAETKIIFIFIFSSKIKKYNYNLLLSLILDLFYYFQ